MAQPAPIQWLRRALRSLLELVYGLYAVAVFVPLATLALVAVTLVPGLSIDARRAVAHGVARLFFIVAGMRLTVRAAHLLPEGPCVVIANHASYLDGVVLKAAMPARFSFVIKKEVNKVPLAGLLLRRIGSAFVDRFNRHSGGMDARRLFKAAGAGQALVFFPEGTILEQPGLGSFRIGAFAIATHAELPIVPVVIRGTRGILPCGRLLTRPGRIEVEVLPPVCPLPDADSALELRDRARARLLAVLGEPDLADTDGVSASRAGRHTRSRRRATAARDETG